jgi:glycosyltransferase involved in cell wall biosynthesis
VGETGYQPFRGESAGETRAVISVVIPVYRGEATLHELVRRLEATLRVSAVDWEILFVNDASPDDSWQVIETFTRSSAHIRAIDLMRNYGQHNALLCGVRAARGDVIVTLDDDLQNPPEEIPKLLSRLDEGFDVVYGAPRRNRQAFWRRGGSWLTRKILSSAIGDDAAANVSAFRAFRTTIREAFAHFDGPHVNLDVILTWGAARFSSVEVVHQQRAAGASNYTLRMLLRHASNMVTGFTVLPLQLASITGLSLTVAGVLLLIYILAVYLVRGRVVPGFYFLASLMVLFGGAQLFALGIIGEYLARMHFHAMRRGSYAIRREIGPTQPRTDEK